MVAGVAVLGIAVAAVIVVRHINKRKQRVAAEQQAALAQQMAQVAPPAPAAAPPAPAAAQV